MISKELFLSMATEEGDIEKQTCEYKEVVNAHKHLISSIGSCGECDRFILTFENFGKCFLDETYGSIWNKHDYCSKFEPKETK